MEPSDQSFSYAKKEIDNLFPKIDFSKTRKYAQRYIGIDGVKRLLAEANANESAYLQKKELLIDQNMEAFNNAWEAKNQAVDKHHRFSLLWKTGIIVFIILVVLIMWFKFKSGPIKVVYDIACYITYAAIIGGVIGSVITHFMENSAFNNYYLMTESLGEAIRSATSIYASTNESLYSQIDNLYLSSLDPAHREIVLMRRDQERQHQEAMRAQREHNKIIEQEQYRRRLAEEENAKATKRLLEIEEERERRNNS